MDTQCAGMATPTDQEISDGSRANQKLSVVIGCHQHRPLFALTWIWSVIEMLSCLQPRMLLSGNDTNLFSGYTSCVSVQWCRRFQM